MNRAIKLVYLILLVNGAMHLYFGLVFMLMPEDMMALLSIAATSPDGMIEMRTFYGGLMFAMGCFFVLGLFDASITKPALLMLAITYLAAVIVRSYGLLQHSPEGAILYRIYIIELTGLASALLGLYLHRRAT